VTAADASNLNQCAHTGKEVIYARNSGAGARTVTITSVSYLGRTGHITAESIAAGATKVFGPFSIEGWKQTDGYLYFQAEHAEVLFTVLTLP
jgi:hypothetical protein